MAPLDCIWLPDKIEYMKKWKYYLTVTGETVYRVRANPDECQYFATGLDWRNSCYNHLVDPKQFLRITRDQARRMKPKAF